MLSDRNLEELGYINVEDRVDLTASGVIGVLFFDW